MIVIDGSQGEGGGQVLRSALSLSMLTGSAFRIDNIRAGRSKPGLLRQHLTSVQAASAISNATVTGDSLGSVELTFAPNKISAGQYRFAIGTAGSTSLVLQTVLMPLLFAGDISEVTIVGGTHARFAPAFEFLAQAYLPLLNRMGADINLSLVRHGFYPRGGGEVRLRVAPIGTLKPIEIKERGSLIRRSARALVAAVPGSVAVRELNVVKRKMELSEIDCQLDTLNDKEGPGNAVMITHAYQNVAEVFVEYGERGISAETVAKRVCTQARAYDQANVAVGKYLADQLLLPMAIAGGGQFTTSTPSAHFLTNADVISQFTNMTTRVHEDRSNDIHLVEVG